MGAATRSSSVSLRERRRAQEAAALGGGAPLSTRE